MATDREILQQKIKDTPRRVFQAFYLAALLGCCWVARHIAANHLRHFLRQALFFTLIIVAFFVFNGISLLTRNRLAYVLLAVSALPPVLGSLVGATHLVTLLVTGEITRNPIDTSASVVATL